MVSWKFGIVENSPTLHQNELHLEEFESAESAERTMSGHDENVEALSYRSM